MDQNLNSRGMYGRDLGWPQEFWHRLMKAQNGTEAIKGTRADGDLTDVAAQVPPILTA